MAAKKFQILVTLHEPCVTPAGKDPVQPDWKQLADALNAAFDLVRQNRTTLASYHGSAHEIYILPDALVRLAEERIEEELTRSLLGSDASDDAAPGQGQHGNDARDVALDAEQRGTCQRAR